MHNNNNNNNNNNNSNNSSNNNSNLKNNYGNWCNNVAANMQQQLQLQLQQQQQQLQQQHQQARISNWIAETNKNQQGFNNNNNNNNMQCNNNQNLMQQQQQQQHYLQQQYNNYQLQQQQQQQPAAPQQQQTQHNVTCATSNAPPSPISCYYAQRLQPPPQQQPQQQHNQVHNQQQQQHQHQPHQQVQRPLHSPYATAINNQAQAQQHPQQHHHQQQQQPLQHHPQTPHRIQQPHQQQQPPPQQQQQQQQQQQHQQQQQRRLVSVDGIQSGVPTLTTSTLTPTTLRSIEETFIQLTSEPINAPYQAGFIPPPLAPFPSTSTTAATITAFNGSLQDYNDVIDTDSDDSQSSWNAAHLNEENSLATTDTSSAATDSTSFQNGLNGMGNNSLATSNTSSTNDFTAVNIAIAAAAAASAAKNGLSNTSNSATNATPTTTRRNQGGRRPNKSANMTPEEEEKRRIRRERNKLAAARCRKRRVDQTNELLEEVAHLEKKREVLQKDIESLNTTKQELEYILEAHRPTCQKVRQDLLSVNTFGGLIAPTNNSNDSNSTIIGMDTTLASTGRSVSPVDLKPVIMHESIMLPHIKNEPLDCALDSNSSLDHDGPPSPKRILLSNHNPMIPPPLPNVATLSASLAAAASASLNTPIVTTAPVSFSTFGNSNATLNALNALHKPVNGGKPRPNSLPTMPRNLAQNLGLNVDNKPPTDINGVAIQTPSTGMFNFDSLMDGGTGLTPVSGPLVPTCSSQNKHPLELATPTSEPSKLVSL